MSELELLRSFYNKVLTLRMSPVFEGNTEQMHSYLDGALAKVSKFNAVNSHKLTQAEPACCFCDDDGNPCNYCNKLPSFLREQAS